MRKYQNSGWLKRKYWDDGYSMMQVAELAGACYVTVWTWMNKFGIPRRSHYDAYWGNGNHRASLDQKAINFLNGLLLGDGYLYYRDNEKCALYSHTDKNLSYLVWLSSVLGGMGIKQMGKIGIQKTQRGTYSRYRSLHYVELGNLARIWYPNGEKIVPDNLILSPTTLLNWYIGDGNYSREPVIDSSCFSMQALSNLAAQIEGHGIKLSLREYKDRKRLRIARRSEAKFFDFILSEIDVIPQCYHYKFPQGACRAA